MPSRRNASLLTSLSGPLNSTSRETGGVLSPLAGSFATFLRVTLGNRLARYAFLTARSGSQRSQTIVPADLRFNLSHSGNVALYAVTRNREIGVDVERIDSSFVHDGIEEKFFSRNEVAKLRSLDASERPRAFFNCWTRKEAYVKACGGGLQISLPSFDVSLAPHEAAAFLSKGESGWSLLALPLGRDHAAAIAVEGNNWELRSWQWQMQPTE